MQELVCVLVKIASVDLVVKVIIYTEREHRSSEIQFSTLGPHGV